MYRRAYAHLLSAITTTALALGFATSLAAHTGQQAFDTLESITGEQSDLSTPASLKVSAPFEPLTGKALLYAVFPEESLAN